MPQYANINSVYSVVKDILNKQQLGFITPQQFNVFAPQAQKELVDEILELIQRYARVKQRMLDDHNSTTIKGLRDDIYTLLVYNEQLALSSGTNIFSYPERYQYVEGLTCNNANVDIIQPNEAAYHINNYFTPPTNAKPIAILSSLNITVFPVDLVNDIFITYYKNPMGSQNGTGVNQPPSWQFTQVGEDLLYNAVTSVDFELPKSVEQKLAYKVLALAGFSIREPEAVQFANAQEQKDKVTENE